MWTDLVGWISTVVLIVTIGRQAFTQWKERSTAGMSRWLFIGQLVASTGFVVYSYLLGNIVFVVSNLFLLVIAAVGQWLYVRNKKREEGSNKSTQPARGRDGRRS